MITRKEKIEALLESFSSLRRNMAFRAVHTAKMPRITPSQWGALMIIEQRGESTLKDVAKACCITSSAATQLINGLVSSKYVVRKTRADDRRAVTLVLSNKTKAYVDAMKKQAVQKFITFFEILSNRELDQYVTLNKKIVERFLKNKTI